jgi:hypothetical protein
MKRAGVGDGAFLTQIKVQVWGTYIGFSAGAGEKIDCAISAPLEYSLILIISSN